MGAARAGPHRTAAADLHHRAPADAHALAGVEVLADLSAQVDHSPGDDGLARLLEVNTRAASGLFQSAVSGVNLPYLALRLLLDGRVDVPTPQLGATVISYNEAFPAHLPW